MISIQNLHKTFGKNTVLKSVSLRLTQPGIFAILGPNGSGKTTLIKSILGMVIPDKGEILFNGKNIHRQWNYRDQIDYLPQIARFPENLTVQEVIEMVKNLRPRPAGDQALIEHLGLKPFLSQRLGNLSGGTRQKVNLVLAFMYDSSCLILDEPTSGLDPVAMLKLKQMIHQEKEKGKTILITSHIMGFVEEIADEIVFLLEGDICFRGTPEELRSRYGTPDIESAIAALLQSEPVTPQLCTKY
ncbi:MAG: ABC transporter ATP-binding protein [Bacteroidia bacterium]|nr:ABC transporter ATP-binding protein [Bacteroidia bacterium]